MYRLLTAATAVLVLYGSLFPFQFAAAPEGAWQRLWHEATLWSGLGDMIGNVVLFLPWGAACAAWLRERHGATTAAVLALAGGLALALAAQLGQLWLPARQPALGDVAWNLLGCVLGLPGAHALRRLARAEGPDQARMTARALLVLSLALLLFPLLPSVDLALVKSHLKALREPSWQLQTIADAFVPMAVAAWALPQALPAAWSDGRRAIAPGLLLAGLLALLPAKLFIVQAAFDASVLLGSLAGVLAAALIVRFAGARAAPALAGVLLLVYVLGALAPFVPRDEPGPMNWVPFAGLLRGSMLDNSRRLLTQLLLFTAVLRLATLGGSPLRASTLVLAVAALLVEFLQCLVQTRFGDTSAPTLALLSGVLLAALAPARHAPAAAAVPTAPPARRAVGRTDDRPVRGTGRGAGHGPVGLHPAAWALLLALPIALALYAVLRLPGIPYNLRELFRGDGHPLALGLFALALLWLGAGPAALGRWLAARGAPHWRLPAGALAVALVSLALVAGAATGESLEDIAGSSNLVWFVLNKNLWGETGRAVFLALDMPGTIGLLERCVRYAALLGPLPVVLGGLVAFGHRWQARTLDLRWTLSLLVSAGLLLWLCKLIAFSWSSTDNLNELVARPGEWGLGGGGWLYALLVLLCASAWCMARAPGRGPAAWAGAGLALALSAGLGWWLFNAGLNPAVEKYSRVFSGAQFLLGPDRQRLLSTELLALRWVLLVTATLLVTAAGIWLEARAAAWRQRAGAAPARPASAH